MKKNKKGKRQQRRKFMNSFLRTILREFANINFSQTTFWF